LLMKSVLRRDVSEVRLLRGHLVEEVVLAQLPLNICPSRVLVADRARRLFHSVLASGRPHD
jgi:hypothetical protein